MQGRFNLNNLGHVGTDGKPDPQPLAQFQRLLVSVGLEPKWAGMARDWIDADDQPGDPDGAEDQIYTSQTPPYRTANYPMMSPTELMNLPGFGADRYRKIAPYVTALPTATATINICTAPALVIESLADQLRGEYSGSPEILANGRKEGCFPDSTTLGNVVGGSAAVSTMRKLLRGNQHLFQVDYTHHARHYGVHLVQSFAGGPRWQGNAPAAHVRNDLKNHAEYIIATTPGCRLRRHGVVDHRRRRGTYGGPAARPAEPRRRGGPFRQGGRARCPPPRSC